MSESGKIPEAILNALNEQNQPLRPKKEIESVNTALKLLGLTGREQLAEFHRVYYAGSVFGHEGTDEMLTLYAPDYTAILEATNWARGEGNDLPDQYICLSSHEGGGFYVYSNRDSKVYDVDFGEPWQKLNAGELEARWESFYEFLEWYVKGCNKRWPDSPPPKPRRLAAAIAIARRLRPRGKS